MNGKGMFYKYEIADKLGVCRRTFTKWLNVKYFAELQQLGYTKNQKLITIIQYNWLNLKLGIDD